MPVSGAAAWRSSLLPSDFALLRFHCGYNTRVFTGLIRHIGKLRSRPAERLQVACPTLRPELAHGDSVAVNGACLTVAELTGDGFIADLLEDTRRGTTLGSLAAGQRVNLELPLAAGERFGGHFVQGHVDGTVKLLEKRELSSSNWRLTFELPAWLAAQVIDQGSIAIDGVSLTIQELGQDRLSVSLIPTTYNDTALGDIQPGGMVNVEADLVVKAARGRPAPEAAEPPPLSLADLKKLGYS